ncbi:MAG: GspE/PulE family protein [Planctomycetota bacterium]|jgi:type II secretory ATPase GspE/PulE/Tfp pilus assembly ATPase PilB-like protein
MPHLILTAVQYGGYISIPKFVAFLVLFFLWLWLVTWVFRDAEAVGTNAAFQTAIVFAAGAAGIILWLLIPLFAAGILIFLIAVTVTALAYVKHRNTQVLDYDRILTANHIKGLFVSEQKKLDALKGLVFITANNNEVPMPQPKTPDFFGYRAACDIFTDAIWRRASDVIFAPTPQDYKVVYQVDGTAIKQPARDRVQIDYFIRFLKSLADLDINEKRKPQKGSFRLHQGDQRTDWELSTAGSTAGEKVLIKQTTRRDVTRLTDIGLTPDQYDLLNGLREARRGLFIVSGPRRSGVTTTFYALLRNHDAFINSINTLEREPSTELPNITQNLFALSDTGTTTFDKKLMTMMRMGPDIVGIADCQDSETAQVAANTVKGVKMMYLTLEADSIVKALGKWIKLVGDRNLSIENLLGISNQRLLRQLCTECKQAYAPNKALLRKFSIPAEKAKVLYRAGKVIYGKHGKESTCDHCQGTGYVGRTGVFENITLNQELKKAVVQSKSFSEIHSLFRSAKMRYLQEQALIKVVDGTTSINEMLRVFSEASTRNGQQG